jgi:hypothetical protein
MMSVALAQEGEAVDEDLTPAPPTDLSVHAEDDGLLAVLHWNLSNDDGAGKNNVVGYAILRGEAIKGPFEIIDTVSPGTGYYEDIIPVIELPEDTVLIEPISPPEPASDVVASDNDNDHGHGIVLDWKKSSDDVKTDGENRIISYIIFRSMSPEGPFKIRGMAPAGDSHYEDIGSKERSSRDFMPDYTDFYYKLRTQAGAYLPGRQDYYYSIRALSPIDSIYDDCTSVRFVGATYSDSEIVGPVQCYGQWFNTGRIPVLVFVIGFMATTVIFITRAKRGAKLFVRRLAGIEAVDEAIGRATEMGKPILYVLGLGTAAEIATIASFTILGRVAKKVAEYQTGLIVPCYDPIVMTVAQETVRTGFMDAGRPDSYNQDMVYFVTQSQFAYVAAVNGVMLRELPATNIYMGKFFAESLILAETGALAGSIQIAGTDEIAQIPFFVVACDYTLIGEELYAASAYLGREPILLGSLKAQDYAKAAVMIFALIGFITLNFGWDSFAALFHVAN